MIAGKATPTPKERVQVLQERLGRSAKENPTRQYGNLHDKVWRTDVLQEAWRRVSRNRGAAGVDGISIEWIREYGVNRFLTEIGEVLRNGEYHPDYVRRVYMQKGDGSERPLGIPTVADPYCADGGETRNRTAVRGRLSAVFLRLPPRS